MNIPDFISAGMIKNAYAINDHINIVQTGLPAFARNITVKISINDMGGWKQFFGVVHVSYTTGH
jgi:hypothetical protein